VVAPYLADVAKKNIEWILYRIYTVCENIKVLTNKHSFIVKNIFD
jgi:hypothetical protein